MGLAFKKEGEEDLTFGSPLIGTFLLGPFYFLICRAYIAAAIYFGIAFLTAGIGWLVLPFCSEVILRGYYKKQGWQEIPYQKREKGSGDESEMDVIIYGLGGLCCISVVLILVLLALP